MRHLYLRPSKLSPIDRVKRNEPRSGIFAMCTLKIGRGAHFSPNPRHIGVLWTSRSQASLWPDSSTSLRLLENQVRGSFTVIKSHSRDLCHTGNRRWPILRRKVPRVWLFFSPVLGNFRGDAVRSLFPEWRSRWGNWLGDPAGGFALCNAWVAIRSVPTPYCTIFSDRLQL